MLEQRRKRHGGRLADPELERRRDAKILQLILVAPSRVAILRHGRDPKSRGLRQRDVVVVHHAHQPRCHCGDLNFVGILQARHLADLIDDPTCRTPAEQHGRGAHQHLDRA